jgi:hypothetical protein
MGASVATVTPAKVPSIAVSSEFHFTVIRHNDSCLMHLTTKMLSYIVGFLAFILFAYNPLVQILGLRTGTTQIQRTPRPQLNEELLALESLNGSSNCRQDPGYSVHIFSREPLVLYIENFLTAEEREHLLEIRLVACPAVVIWAQANPSTSATPDSSRQQSLMTAVHPLIVMLQCGIPRWP